MLWVLVLAGAANLGISIYAGVPAARNGDGRWLAGIVVGWVVGVGWLVGLIYLQRGGGPTAAETESRTDSPLSRGALLGMSLGFVLGCIAGLVEGGIDYPPSGWFGVALYVGLVGMVVGTLVGLLGGAIVVGWRSVRHALGNEN